MSIGDTIAPTRIPPAPLWMRRRAPSKKWRNKYRATPGSRCKCLVTGESFIASGDGIVWGRVIWPSKEIAEQKAIDDALRLRLDGKTPAEHLGAFEDPDA